MEEIKKIEKQFLIGFAIGFIGFTILGLANEGGFASIVLGLFMGLIIGLAVPSFKDTCINAWKSAGKIKDSLHSFIGSFITNPDNNFAAKFFIFLFILYPYFACYVCCSPFITIYRYLNLKKLLGSDNK